MKITNEIFQVGGSGFTLPEDAAVYLIAFGGHAAIIDTGCGNSTQKLIDNIVSCGVDLEQIEYILLTHCHFDHTGGVKKLSEMFECKIVAHELDAVYLEAGDNTVTAATWYGSEIQSFSVDIKITESKEDIPLGERFIAALHVPGHSPGSLVYLTESNGLKVLFGQDIHGPLDSSLLSDKKEYLKSLEMLMQLDAEVLCEGHFGVFKGKEEVKRFISSFLYNTTAQ